MKIYFNSIGIITNVSNIGDSLRQGSVGNVLEAHFEGVDNAYHSAKFNFTRSDGSKVNNVVMEWDNNNAEVFRFVFNDSWFFALAGTTTLTIYLYDTNGNVTTQGQHQFSIESTDYDEEPTITLNQYNEIMTAIAGKVATSNIIDNLESDASDKPLSARMGKALKQDVDAVAEELPDKIVKKHTYNGPIKFDESLNNLGFNSFEEIRNTDIVIWENPNLIDVGDDFTIYKGTYIFRKQSETSNDNLFVFSCLLTGFYTFSPIVGDKTVISLTLGTTISETLEAVATVSRNNATTIKYSNKDSGLKASRVQNAIDELADKTVKNTENVSNLNKETDSINGKIIDLKNALYGSILATEQQTYENVGVAQIDRANGYPVVDNQKAQVMSIKGKTLNVNQLLNNSVMRTVAYGGLQISPLTNGKIGIHIEGTATLTGNQWICDLRNITPNLVGHTIVITSNSSLSIRSGNVHINTIRKVEEGQNNYIVFDYEEGKTYNEDVVLGLIDLTQMFGAGKEPTTIDEFNRLTMGFDFDTYNEGTIESTNITKIISNPFNLFDGELEVGYDTENNGVINTDYKNGFYGVNLIRVQNGVEYTLLNQNVPYDVRRIEEFDENKTYIKGTNNYGNSNWVLKLQDNTCYVRIMFSGLSVMPTDAQVCFHLTGNGTFNGTYRPHIAPTEYPIPTVKLNGIGTAQDEITETQTKRVIDKVDLGTPNWTYVNGTFRPTNITNAKQPIGYETIPNALCSKYKCVSNKEFDTGLDKCFSITDSTSTYIIRFRDTSITDTTTFAQENDGMPFYYETAKEVTETVNELFLPEIILEGVERGGTIATDSNGDITLTHVVYKPIQ